MSRAEWVERALDELEISTGRQHYRSILTTVAQLSDGGTDSLDLKIASIALREMAEAFRVFRPFRKHRKLTIFGSARTLPEDPLYSQARDLAHQVAEEGWMVVTGAGPGIMAAGAEGAGREMSIGVNIRLPQEQSANSFIVHDPKLVEMRYFFTRKLMLIKESDGYAVLPGGFGTLDEAFELLTLLQTGKAEPAPIVLLDTPEGEYWKHWERFLQDDVRSEGFVSGDDWAFFKITSDIEDAVSEVLGFYRNYHSCRWVGDLLVLRMLSCPSPRDLQDLSSEFSDIVIEGSIRRINPLPPERAGEDHLELERVALRFDRIHYGRLRKLIDRLNNFVD